MSIEQIICFLAIVNHGSFTEAAYQENISQSSISKQIKKLEDELGVELFSRNKNKIKLTSAGYEFLKFAKEANFAYYNMLNSISIYKGTAVQTIRIGSITALSDYNIDAHLGKFQSKYPSIKIDLKIQEQTKLERMLQTNNLDVAFIRTRYLNSEDIETLKFIPDEMGIVCQNDSLLTKKKEISLESITRERLITLDESSNVYFTLLNECKKNNVPLNIVMTNSRHETILSYVKEGLGISILPKRLFISSKNEGLSFLPFSDPINSGVYLVCLKENFHNPIVQKLWKYTINAKKQGENKD